MGEEKAPVASSSVGPPLPAAASTVDLGKHGWWHPPDVRLEFCSVHECQQIPASTKKGQMAPKTTKKGKYYQQIQKLRKKCQKEQKNTM